MGNQYVGFGKETSSYGAYAAPTSFLEIISESLKLERAYDPIETFRSYSTRDMVLLNSIVRGDMEILANYQGLNFLFLYLLGSADYTTGGGNTHTFPASTGIPATDRIGLSLSATVRRDTSLYWRYTGLKPISFGHQFGIDAAQRMTVGWVGKTETTATTGATATYPSLLPMDPADASINFSGGSALPATSVQITVENPVDELYVLGSTTIAREPVRNGVLKCTFSADIVFEDFTSFYDYFDGTTTLDTQIVSTNGTESLTYNFDSCRILQATPAVSGRDRLVATVEGESFYTSDAVENMQVIAINSDTTSEV